MNKTIKILLILSLSLIFIGIAIFTAAFFINGRNFADISLSSVDVYEDRVEELRWSDFDNIDISVTSRNVTIRPADDGVARIETRDSERDYLSTSFNGNTLHIKQIVNQKWYDFMSVPINFGNDIVIYLPRDEYASLSIELTSGDIDVMGNISFGKASFDMTSGSLNLSDGFNSGETEIESTSGSINVSGLDGTSLYIHSTSGSIKLENVIESESIVIESTSGKSFLVNVIGSESIVVKSTSGEIILSRCDAKGLTLESSSGDIKGTIASPKLFVAESASGSIKVPELPDADDKDKWTSDRCIVKTSSGNIHLEVYESSVGE